MDLNQFPKTKTEATICENWFKPVWEIWIILVQVIGLSGWGSECRAYHLGLPRCTSYCAMYLFLERKTSYTSSTLLRFFACFSTIIRSVVLPSNGLIKASNTRCMMRGPDCFDSNSSHNTLLEQVWSSCTCDVLVYYSWFWPSDQIKRSQIHDRCINFMISII